jgi:hypothetical protein
MVMAVGLELLVLTRENERGEAEWGWLFQSEERTLYRLRKEHFVLLCLRRCLKYEYEISLTEKSQ